MSPLPFNSNAFASPSDSSFWQTDKREHFAATAAISGSTYVLLRTQKYNRWESLVTSVALSLIIGTAKEVYDRSVDPDDIRADSIGATIGSGVFFTIDLMAF